MPDIKLLCPDGKYREYRGIESLTVDSVEPEGKPVKFLAIENPITLLVEGVDYTLDNVSGVEESDDGSSVSITLR